MLNKQNYVISVVILMTLLLITRILDSIRFGLDARTIIFTIIELIFWAWGIFILLKTYKSKK